MFTHSYSTGLRVTPEECGRAIVLLGALVRFKNIFKSEPCVYAEELCASLAQLLPAYSRVESFEISFTKGDENAEAKFRLLGKVLSRIRSKALPVAAFPSM